MKKILGSIILCLVCQMAIGQTISGKVEDSETGEVLVGANVVVDGTVYGAVTDVSGRFSITTKQLPIVITVSYIGYKTQKVTINAFEPISVALKRSEETLSELLITDNPVIEKVFKKGYTVKDYEFYDNYILLLVYKGYFKKHSLLVTDGEGEVLSELSIKNLQPVGFFKGCLDGVHLLTNTFSRQIYLLGHSIHFLEKTPVKVFLAELEPCIGANADYVFYKKSRYSDQQVDYFSILKIDAKEKNLLVSVANERKIEMLEDEASFQQLRRAAAAAHNAGQPQSSNFANDLVSSSFADRTVFKPIYVPLFEYQDTMFLFNHLDGKLVKMDVNGAVIKTAVIEYQKDKKWRKKILFDEEKGKAYTLMDTKWAITLHEIDLQNGELSAALKLDRPHITNMKIRGGYLYFLYYAPQHGANVKRLEKLRIY